MPPPQAGEAAVVAVGRDPLAAGLDRERGEVGVSHEVALRVGLAAEAREERPVSGPGLDGNGVRVRLNGVRERQRLAVLLGGEITRGCVTTRTNLLRTRSETA